MNKVHDSYVNIEYSYAVPREHEADAEGESWTNLCGITAISSNDLPDFCILESDSVTTDLVCNAQTNAHVDTHRINISQTKNDILISTEISLNVLIDCAVLTW